MVPASKAEKSGVIIVLKTSIGRAPASHAFHANQTWIKDQINRTQ
jgi:hypothetical protein